MPRAANKESCIVQLKLNKDQKPEAITDSSGKHIIHHPPPDIDSYPLDTPDNRTLAFELKRNDKDTFQSEASPILTCLLCCNTCAAFCGTRSQAKNTVFYMPGYFSKLPTDLEHS